jgi:predicted permease
MGAFTSPLPVPQGERLMGIRYRSLETGQDGSSVHDYARWRELGLASFEQLAAARSYKMSVHDGEPGAPQVPGAEMTPSAFALLGATPLLGRLLGPADEVPGAANVMLLGETLWRSRFGADPGIIGRTLRVGRVEHTVVGVLPASFRYPMNEDVWLPLRTSPLDQPEGQWPEVWVFGRLAPGVTADRAEVEVAQMTERLAAEDPETFGRTVGKVVPMPWLLLGSDFDQTDPEVLMMQSVLLAMLLIVCGNVGILLMARTVTRMGEISIRTALGASRARIVTQLFTEALVLAVVATGLGLLATEATAQWLMRAKLGPAGLPFWFDMGLRADTVLVALGLSVVAATVAGVLPALRATGRGVQANLQKSAGRTSVRFGFATSLLIVAEVVLSVGFLALGGTMVRSVLQDPAGELGLEPGRYLRADLSVTSTAAPRDPASADPGAFASRESGILQEVLRRLAEDGEVRGVGLGGNSVAQYVPSANDIVIEGSDPAAPTPDAARAAVDVSFFRGVRRPILEGRDFTTADVQDGPEAGPTPVIVNTSFVERLLGGRNAVGQRFRLAQAVQAESGPAWFEIVGVVGPFGMNPINPAEDAGFYEPFRPGSSSSARFLIEVAGDPAAFAPRFREIVAAVDPEATVDEALSLEQAWAFDASIFKLFYGLQIILAGVAFVLAVSGLYALMSFTVSQRTREVAIRSALGARPWSIVSTITRWAALHLAIGLALGGVWGWVLLRIAAGDMSEVQAVNVNEPLTIAVTLGIAGIVGVLGCASPTLRGLRIQPSQALRES